MPLLAALASASNYAEVHASEWLALTHGSLMRSYFSLQFQNPINLFLIIFKRICCFRKERAYVALAGTRKVSCDFNFRNFVGKMACNCCQC